MPTPLNIPPQAIFPSSSRPRPVVFRVPEPNADFQPREPANDYRSTSHPTDRTPIVIDNGSSQLRAGWGDESSPRIVSDQVFCKFKDRKANKTVLLYGQDTEIDATCRAHAKPIFDGDVLVNLEGMEHALDYTFLNLGIDTEAVNHPVLMTERLQTPLLSRSVMSELLFEAYSVPSVTYGVDTLFSFSRTGARDGVAIGMGNASTHIIPVVGGRGIMSSARQLNWGGSQANELLLKLVQMKYPTFPTKVTPAQSTLTRHNTTTTGIPNLLVSLLYKFMYRETCYFSQDYESDLRMLADPSRLVEIDTVMQFPFVAPVVEEKTEEELLRAAEKKKENGRRLQEMQQKQRLEKEADMTFYSALKAAKATEKKASYQARLENAGFEDDDELEAAIKKIEDSMKRARKKDLGENAEPEEEPSFPLVDVPDADLTEDEIKEKRRQKLMKAGYDARMRLKAEKLAEKAKAEELEKQEEDERINNPASWSAKIREEHEATITRMSDRKRRKEALGDRKSAAAQGRMKSIANLAAEGPSAAKKRKRGGDDDGFGKTDDDWAVYREIGGGNDTEDEEEDLGLITTLEAKLLAYDPTFTNAETLVSRNQQQTSLLNAFLRGLAPNQPVSEGYDPESVEQSFQLHLNVERSRVPEVWFEPHMAGLDSAGIAEIVEHVLNEMGRENKAKMQQMIYATGGSSSIPGFISRLSTTLRPVLPYASDFRITGPQSDPRLDAWKGMAEWSRTAEFQKAQITKREYEEYGGEYVKEHRWGNYRTG